MKKILSLLSMLMITVMAFATDYKGQLDYILTTRNGDLTGPSYAQGTLKIELYAGGKYTVTATGCDLSSIDKDLGNWDEIICEGVEGTTDANGVTTIDVAPYAFRGSDNAELKNAKLFVKFKDDKAYATFAGTYNPNFFTNYTLKYTFGVDEGFDGGGSTGGGETGGETSSIVTVKENFQSTEGSSWGENVTIDWNTQKLVVSVNLASTGSDKGFLGVTKKGQTAGWNNYGIIFYNTNGSTVQGYAPGQPNNANTNQVTKGEDPVRFEISKDGGVKCQGNVVISASNIAHLTNQSEIVVGAADKPAGALYNYIKVVPLDWKETTEPEVTVVATKKFNDVDYSNTWSQAGTANVTFEEMSDETVKMKFTTDGINISADALTKGTDDKGRTTYTGEAVNDAMSTITYTIKAVVYTEGTAEKLYMTMTATGVTFVVGENPDTEVQKPVVYKNTLKVVRGTDTKTYEDAEVSVLAKGEGMYEVTLPKFSDMDNVPGELGPITFQAKGVEENGKVVLTATDQEFTLTNTGWKNDVVKVSMKGEIESEMLKATFNVNHSSMSGYNYTLYYGVEAPEVVTEESNKTYKSNLRIADQTSEDENAYLFQTDEATVNIIKYSDKTYKITLKQITLNSKTSDLVFTGKAVESEVDPGEGGVVETEGTMVQATADAETQNFLGGAVNAQFMWQDVSATEIRMSFVLEGKSLSLGGEFNYEKKDPDQPKDDYAVNFDKTAKSTHSSRALNSFSLQQTGKDKQTESVYASKAAYEDHTSKVFTVEAGSELTASFDYTGEWMHSFVYIDFDNDGQFSYKEGQWDQTGTDLVAFSFYSLDSNPKNDASGYNSVGDELTGDARNTYAAPSFKAPAKAGEYRIRFKFDWNCILPGGSSTILSDGGGVWDATLKVVEPVVDGISTINAEAANGVQFFTVDGVKLSKLQKGLNIVRTADGKVKKVLVK